MEKLSTSGADTPAKRTRLPEKERIGCAVLDGCVTKADRGRQQICGVCIVRSSFGESAVNGP